MAEPSSKAPKKAPRRHPPPKASQPASRTCSLCGLTERCAAGGIPPGWSFSVEGKRTQYICPACARANIRAIEGKLPEEYWE
jgi:transposase